jgi:hypothetical protein
MAPSENTEQAFRLVKDPARLFELPGVSELLLPKGHESTLLLLSLSIPTPQPRGSLHQLHGDRKNFGNPLDRLRARAVATLDEP